MSARRLLWHGLDSPAWLITLGVVGVLAVSLIVLLNTYERRLISRKLGWTLLLLRFAVIACLLVILLEPVLSWTTDSERTGRLVVAIDASFSMDTKDVQATSAEKLKWARAAGLIGNAESDSQLDRWIASYEKSSEPEWATRDEEPDADRRELLAKSRRENVISVLKEVDKLSRKDLVQRLLTGGRDNLLKQLERQGALELTVFGGGTTETDEKNLAATLKEPPKAVEPESTDLSQAVATSASIPGAGPLAGVVVLSDGRNSTDQDASRLTSTLKDVGVPVYPVMIGSERRPKDLAIAVLDAPPTVFQHDKPVIRATLRTAGFSGQEIKVQLERPDIPDEPPLTKTITPTGPTTNVEFAIDTESLGRRRYRLKTDPLPDETRADNNERQFTLQVVDDQADVLVLDGEPRWEFRYMQSAYERDERVKLDVVVFRQPFLGVLQDTFFPRTLKLPDDASQIADSPFSKYDLVIVGDVAPQQLSETGWKLLDRYVREEGGTLILTAGKRYFPKAHRSDIVQSLLPVTELKTEDLNDESETGRPEERGFRWQLTGEGETLDILKFAADDEGNRRVWSHLPGHLWGMIGIAKPGATVWASQRTQQADTGLDWERQHVLFAQHFVGSGQVLWLGIDSTWRWRYLVGDRYHHRFWGQLARWAAEFKSAVGNEFVRFGVDRPNIARGEDAVIRARWDAKLLKRFPNLAATADVMRIENGQETKVSTIDLKPTPERPLVFEGHSIGLKGGEYRVKLQTANAKVGDTPVVAELLVSEPMTPELTDVSANPEWLGQLAQTTGGRMFHIDEIDDLPRVFEKASETVTTREEVSVWDHWLALALMFALLTTEWVLRKVNGLP